MTAIAWPSWVVRVPGYVQKEEGGCPSMAAWHPGHVTMQIGLPRSELWR